MSIFVLSITESQMCDYLIITENNTIGPFKSPKPKQRERETILTICRNTNCSLLLDCIFDCNYGNFVKMVSLYFHE